MEESGWIDYLKPTHRAGDYVITAEKVRKIYTLGVCSGLLIAVVVNLVLWAMQRAG